LPISPEKKRKRDTFEKSEGLRKARKRIEADENKSKAALRARGVAAHKAEKARKLVVQELRANGRIVPFNVALPIRDLEKEPTQGELDSLLLNSSLIQALNGLLSDEEDIPIDLDLAEDKIEIRLERIQEENVIP